MDLFRSHSVSRPRNERVLEVEEGQVMCPRRGPVDIEECWACRAYRGLSSGPAEGVLCSTEPMTLPFQHPLESAAGSRSVA